ncbi:hypothetical protein E3N88_14226 [Mikania micrantha]|uniref:Retrovirus-related Pol polyprotein from transposon TNT 1-94-like beta-barrel domain-containing protein n=1 Tax=Mikania micrantha TaxID=192012 RepID=A0A5N6P3G5_9ASTR|nr:hypothetical protein E3N88_14226 [Mikania micrantha]
MMHGCSREDGSIVAPQGYALECLDVKTTMNITTSILCSTWAFKLVVGGNKSAAVADAFIPRHEKISNRSTTLCGNTEELVLQVSQHESAQDMWSALKTRFVGADRVREARLQTLQSEFEALKMSNGETINEFAAKLSRLASKSNSLGSTINNRTLVKKLLGSVPDKFIAIVASIEQFANLSVMSFQEAIGRLKAFEERTRPKDQVPKEINCCSPTKTGRPRKGKRAQKDLAGVAAGPPLGVEYEVGEQEAGIKISLKRFETRDKNCWFLVNGAGNHMTGNQELFAELDQGMVGRVRFGDGSCVDIKGNGKIVLECKTGEQRVLANVYFIPTLKSNIISLGQMTEIGYEIKMKHEFIWVKEEDGTLLMNVPRSLNRLYKILLKAVNPMCLLANCANRA